MAFIKIGQQVGEMLIDDFRSNTKKKNPQVGSGNPKWPPRDSR